MFYICGDFIARCSDFEDFIESVDNIPSRHVIDFTSNKYGELLCDFLDIRADFKNTKPSLNLNFFWIKNSIVMNLNALFKSIIVVYPLKISESSDKLNVLKTSSIEGRGGLFSETIDMSRFFCCFHPLQIDKMTVFDDLIWHPHYKRIK